MAIKKHPNPEFYPNLARELRKLWPPGMKEHKYPWRESVPSLVARLEVLFSERDLFEYTLEDCLRAARIYLARYEDDASYMQTLKYFVLKQKTIRVDEHHVKYVNESKFADILEAGTTDDTAQSEWDDVFSEEIATNAYEGELV